MSRGLRLRIAAAAAVGLSIAAPFAGAAEEAAAEPLSLSDFGDDAVCEAGDEECALSFRQLRAQVLAPEALLQHRAPDKDEQGAEDATFATAEALHHRAAKSAHRAVTSLVNSVSGKGGMMVYHQTSPEIAQLILREGFKPGRYGWCGGAIYFAPDPKATFTKAVGVDSHKGVILQAWVDTGRICRMEKHCDPNMNAMKLYGTMGCQSVVFNPGDGDELVVYDPSRVHSPKVVWVDPKLSGMASMGSMSVTDPLSPNDQAALDALSTVPVHLVATAGAAEVAGEGAEASAAAAAAA